MSLYLVIAECNFHDFIVSQSHFLKFRYIFVINLYVYSRIIILYPSNTIEFIIMYIHGNLPSFVKFLDAIPTPNIFVFCFFHFKKSNKISPLLFPWLLMFKWGLVQRT